ncbi:unnamed protein product [Caenorhabditis bovis]|uniref:G-protein coupled receptors family 1 profile domain-containing protein n=1 Tax=Caenorhabditis bovis TaxID=2654633 RepID=A0A8S1F432_9PELO|nr:unnamed protein product [Caenorhabditis bovis]
MSVRIDDSKLLDDVNEKLMFHRLNMLVAGVTFIFNILLFVVFLSSRQIYTKEKHQVLLILGIADAANTIAIFSMGLSRVVLFSRIVDTREIPLRTCWECATETWLLLRGIGDLWPPLVQSIFTIQKFSAIFTPLWYYKRCRNGSLILLATSLAILVPSLIVGYVLAWSNRDSNARYYCGRRAAFGTAYATFIYSINIIGYLLSFIINCVNMSKVMTTSNKCVGKIEC